MADELDELRIHLERIRVLLEELVIRGLRACGSDELARLGGFIEHLETTGAAHLATTLATLKGQMERSERESAKTLLAAQTNVRLLERLLTLRVVKGHFACAIAMAEQTNPGKVQPAFSMQEDDDSDEEE